MPPLDDTDRNIGKLDQLELELRKSTNKNI